jgi:hypothetical protein
MVDIADRDKPVSKRGDSVSITRKQKRASTRSAAGAGQAL